MPFVFQLSSLLAYTYFLTGLPISDKLVKVAAVINTLLISFLIVITAKTLFPSTKKLNSGTGIIAQE